VFYGLSQGPLTTAPASLPASISTTTHPSATPPSGLPRNGNSLTMAQANRHQLPVTTWLLPYPGTAPLVHKPASQWTLTLDGDVTQPITLIYADLLVLPQSHQMRRIVSKQGWMMKAEWQGVLMKYVTNKVILKPGVRYVRQENAQGHHQTLPLDSLLKQEALILLREGLHAISPWQGGPLRLMVYDQYTELGLGQITRMSFLSQWPADEPRLEKDGQIQPGKYYAFDLKATKALDRPGEAKAI
jgi:DMSO/TMAO reductase YedYZ molybdopterin-dependent catalytic subunit